MNWFLCLMLCGLAGVISAPLTAQEARREPLVIGTSGNAYLDSLRLRGINTDVAYFDPTAPTPVLDTSQKPEPPKERESISLEFKSITALITISILAGILFVFLRYGGNMSVSFRKGIQNPERARKEADTGTGLFARIPGDLDGILRVSDRRKALVMLAQDALSRTIVANGLLLQRSWTARDALRRLPEGQHHIEALHDLVMASERILFGDRDVSEVEFNEHVARIKPLFHELKT